MGVVFLFVISVSVGMVHIKEQLLLIGKSSPCGGGGGSRFPEWSYTICPTPYYRDTNVLSVSLNKAFSFLPLVSVYSI